MRNRNNKSLNIASVIKGNIKDEINDYRFTFDIPTEIEIQKDIKYILKNEKICQLHLLLIFHHPCEQ